MRWGVSVHLFTSRHGEASPYYLHHKARQEAKKAFVHLDTSRMVVKALVIYRRDNVLGSAATVFSTVSRVIGREAENAYWVLHENVPVLVNARKMRPADEIEVAARRILASTGQNSGLQWFADERAADPVTARVTPRPSAAIPATPLPSVAAPSTPSVPAPGTPMPAPRTPLRA